MKLFEPMYVISAQFDHKYAIFWEIKDQSWRSDYSMLLVLFKNGFRVIKTRIDGFGGNPQYLSWYS